MRLPDFLRQHNVSFRSAGEHRHASANWIQIDCPYCGELEKFHMGLSLQAPAANCWVCGRKNFWETVGQAVSLTAREVRSVLILDRKPAERTRERRSETKIPIGTGPLRRNHARYLQRRGFDPQEISDTWGVLGIARSVPKYSHRLFVPAFDRTGRLISWTTRSLSDSGQRYLSCPAEWEVLPIKSQLYGAHLVHGNSIIIVEGPTDAWRIGPGAVSLLGLSYSPQQLRLLGSFARRVICFDNSRHAQAAARMLADTLLIFPGETLIAELDAEDPATCEDGELRDLRAFLD